MHPGRWRPVPRGPNENHSHLALKRGGAFTRGPCPQSYLLRGCCIKHRDIIRARRANVKRFLSRAARLFKHKHMTTLYNKRWHIGAVSGRLYTLMENPMKKQRLARVVQLDTTTMVVMKRWVWRAYLTYSICADCTLICGLAYVILS